MQTEPRRVLHRADATWEMEQRCVDKIQHIGLCPTRHPKGPEGNHECLLVMSLGSIWAAEYSKPEIWKYERGSDWFAAWKAIMDRINKWKAGPELANSWIS